MSGRPIDEEIAAMPGAAALPRKNGELVFAAPWQSRAFGMAVELRNRGLYDWEDFRRRLIAAVGAGGASDAAPADAAALYYEQWMEALERVLLDEGLITEDELERRRREFESGERGEVY